MRCKHRPVCPPGTTPWVCGRRTEAEQAAADGRLTEGEARRLLALWGVPRSSPSRVYTGERRPRSSEKLW